MSKNKTTFHRKRKKKNYTMIDNDVIRREDLSWKAKGIMVYIFSLPDDWNINLNEVMKHATDGESAFRSGWKELKKAGYVERVPVRDEENKKIKRWETYVYENVDMKATEPHVETQDASSTDVTKENKPSSDASDNIPYKKVVDYLNEKTGSKYRSSTKATKRLIRARWDEGFELDDFKKVIDVKVSDWSNDAKMVEYLRPQTLFGTKFESYLNQPMVESTDGSGGEYDDLF